MLQPLTAAMKIVLGFELVLSILFFMWGWGEGVRNTVGRIPAAQDILFLAIPLVLTLFAAVGAIAFARSGRPAIAWIQILLPLPVAFFLFGLVGAI